MKLHINTGLAELDPAISDCVVAPPPEETAGVLDYERRRRSGYSVFDALIRRDAAPDSRNGVSAFLAWVTRHCVSIRVPDRK